MNDNELDQLIEETLKNMPTEPIIEFEQSWSKVRKRLQRKQQFRKVAGLIAIIAVSFMAGASIFSSPVVHCCILFWK